MNKFILVVIYVLITCWDVFSQTNYILENQYLKREFSTDKYLHTISISNKRICTSLSPFKCNEFVLRLSDGTDKVGTDFILDSHDFMVQSCESYPLKGKEPGQGLLFVLRNDEYGITVEVHYELCDKQTYLHKYLIVKSDRKRTLERVDVESLSLEGAYQPNSQKAITAQATGNWKPGLGQPVYNYVNATFGGIEFPAASNTAIDQNMKLGYLHGKTITSQLPYRSYNSVMGVAGDPYFISEAFFDYIDEIRIRPLRLQVQYNSWYDLGREMDEHLFIKSAQLVHDELVVKRGVLPMNAYVLDDGWQDVTLSQLEQKDGVWTINHKFSNDFLQSRNLMKKLNSRLGIWLSPGCYFGGKTMVNLLKKNGYETLTSGMSMADSQYMDKLENRILKFTEQGISYFKFDGLFGHLHTRNFELKGRGVPIMPQLNTEEMSSNAMELNSSMYDELKMYYIVTGTERLMRIFQKQHEINPDIFIALTNGAFLSPWWLQYVDVIWLINCGDAPRGCKNRSEELVYRDNIYYNTFRIDNVQFPLNSIFNHEPKKTKLDTSIAEFKNYFFMHLSRGTCFVELYLKLEKLSKQDWDVLADGLKWAHSIFPAIKRVKMIGGVPDQQQIYGYSGWNLDLGYISLHNPSSKEKTFSIRLDRDIGMFQKEGSFSISSPLNHDKGILKRKWNYGDVLTLKIPANSIRLLVFDK